MENNQTAEEQTKSSWNSDKIMCIFDFCKFIPFSTFGVAKVAQILKDAGIEEEFHNIGAITHKKRPYFNLEKAKQAVFDYQRSLLTASKRKHRKK